MRLHVETNEAGLRTVNSTINTRRPRLLDLLKLRDHHRWLSSKQEI
jgi:hypothetical protein